MLPTASLNDGFDVVFSATDCKTGSAVVFGGFEGVPFNLALELTLPLGKLFGVWELTARLVGDVLRGVVLLGGGKAGGRLTGEVIRGAIVGRVGRFL